MKPASTVADKKKIKRVKYRLLTVSADAKTVKGEAKGYLTAILYMAPATEADGVTNLCPFATFGPGGCVEACLGHEGRARLYKTVPAARIRRAKAYLADFEGFCTVLETIDIPRFLRHAAEEGLTPIIRLNGTSDQPKLARRLAAKFPQVQFYDYTKIPAPWTRVTANYHLTFSFSGRNTESCLEALAHGVNVAVVFQRALPAAWHGYQVVNGDESDLRFLDRAGVVIGLKAKGLSKHRAVDGGFIQLQPALPAPAPAALAAAV